MVNVGEATIIEPQEPMDRTSITARELVLFYLLRIAQIDQCEGGLNAVLEVNPDALFTADMLDEERKRGRVRRLLRIAYAAERLLDVDCVRAMLKRLESEP